MLARFGYNLRCAREQAELSQAELGELSGMSQGEISRLEAGERGPGIYTVVLLTNALNLDPAVLTDGIWHKQQDAR